MTGLITRGFKSSGTNTILTRGLGFDLVELLPVENPGSTRPRYTKTRIEKLLRYKLDGITAYQNNTIIFCKGILAFYSITLYNIIGLNKYLLIKLFQLIGVQKLLSSLANSIRGKVSFDNVFISSLKSKVLHESSVTRDINARVSVESLYNSLISGHSCYQDTVDLLLTGKTIDLKSLLFILGLSDNGEKKTKLNLTEQQMASAIIVLDLLKRKKD